MDRSDDCETALLPDRIGPKDASYDHPTGAPMMRQSPKSRFAPAWAAIAALVIALLPLAAARADTVTYYVNDLLGSPRIATDSSGNPAPGGDTYLPYGERMGGDLEANKIWYTSRHQDDDTRLIYMGARYYDPVVGRFITTDPKSFSGDDVHAFNRYAYANDNPYRYTDPDGQSPLEVVFLVADTVSLVSAINSGEGIGLAAANELIDVLGVASPIPGISEAAHGIEAAGKVAEGVGEGIAKEGYRSCAARSGP